MNNCDCKCNVKCNVCECMHNDSCNSCMLDTIEITHEQTGVNAMSTPHFCKSFCKK